jgi:hypothetical protein
MAEIKELCHLLHHLQHRMNTGVPAKSGYIYIFLLLCIYMGVFSRGCVYFQKQAIFLFVWRYPFGNYIDTLPHFAVY